MNVERMTRMTAIGHTKAILPKLKHGRHYALGEAELLAIAALLTE